MKKTKMKSKKTTNKYIKHNENNASIIPVRFYPYADIEKSEVCDDNKNKAGIYI
jgi:hypothetical protein